jgi:putative peptide zinc metalloprotease protein
VGLRRRGDLVTNRQVYQGQAWWVVKDPISLHYFRFRPEEYWLLDMLDGQTSLDVLKDQFEAKFLAPIYSNEDIVVNYPSAFGNRGALGAYFSIYYKLK